jgi:hypothetical protein
MRRKHPSVDFPHRVLVYRSNMDAFRGRYASREFLSWMKEHAGPVGVLWKAQRHVDGYEIFFMKDDHAFLAALRWGGA